MLKKIIGCTPLFLFFLFAQSGYCLDLDKVRIPLLKEDYKTAITEGEKILGSYTHFLESDELYYLLGLAYLKDGNYLRAGDIFEIILREFKNSALKDEAVAGLGDSYFLKGDLIKAEGYYKDLLSANPQSRLAAQAYYRLAQIEFKKGDPQKANGYMNKLKTEFPLNLESRMSQEICSLAENSQDAYYTVQVGFFASAKNASNLKKQLLDRGYPVYMEEINTQGRVSYRVRVGKSNQLQEIERLRNKLAQDGYPTKICP